MARILADVYHTVDERKRQKYTTVADYVKEAFAAEV